ncbi:MAG: GAF and ANTAR domain-containing protein [Actinobacteria bacterium]|nr:GAF and ANTAR domain-containing protein [Actinomycetota bacterium]
MSDFPQAGLDAGREALRRFLAGEDDLAAMHTKVALIATETIPGCDIASVTMLKHGKPTTPAFTGKAAKLLDETQYELGDGPCLAAARHRGLEHVSTASDDRWPHFVSAAREQGVRATMSIPLGNDETVVGALNLYSETASAYDDAAQSVACAFADQLGVAVASATMYAESFELAQQLQQAMESRAVIEQAKGILMGAQRCSADAAFAILVRASQNQNRKLRAIASEIVERYQGKTRTSVD